MRRKGRGVVLLKGKRRVPGKVRRKKAQGCEKSFQGEGEEDAKRMRMRSGNGNGGCSVMVG